MNTTLVPTTPIPTSFMSLFAVGAPVLYQQSPAHVVAVIFSECKVHYDLRTDEDTGVLHERVDSCDVHPLT